MFYVESARLVNFLLRDDEPQRLFDFADMARRRGYDAALREHYGLAGVSQLDQRRQENTAAGLVTQASRKSAAVASQTDDDSRSSTADAPIVNVSYQRAPNASPPAHGR